MTAKIVYIDIETQRAVLESFSRFPKFIHEDRVIIPPRILCFAALWRGTTEVIFHASWDDSDTESYRKMIKAAFDLMGEADFVVTFNGDKFDIQWLEAEFGRLNLGRPAPWRSIDLRKIAKKHFSQGLISQSLNWSSRHWLGDEKVHHDGLDLWHQIRYGNDEQRAYAQTLMRKYNIHDTELTGQLFERYLPWISENFALYEEDADDKLRCTQCSSDNLIKQGHAPTKTYMYQRYECKDCGKWNKGRRMMYTNDLRPV